jgi:hypothetical protein
MKQYEINGSIYLCDGDKLYVEVATANTDGDLVFNKNAPAPIVHKKYKTRKAKASADLCHCGRPAGHRGTHKGAKIKKRGPYKKKGNALPPAQEEDIPDDAAPVLSCHICEEDHLTRDCPNFGATIAQYREQGMDSLRIASKLKIRLADIPVE